ncbi:hypothetical protein [Jhaorihella thermophila]|uniref:Uncharacterized protein n=1 Tax=Jhaorihella thermophila TaxID=488547 RepID=A0A1H5WUA4_9RHOB|nr:hypothetical protein [Jhaorihella thermophila]SEG02820.1 hypothetical protein SAMN05421751_1092 [Jhaorihella thermophila]
MIQRHVRDNHDRTDNALHELRCLLIAARTLAEDPNAKIEGTDEANAVHAMMELAWAKMDETETAHLME